MTNSGLTGQCGQGLTGIRPIAAKREASRSMIPSVDRARSRARRRRSRGWGPAGRGALTKRKAPMAANTDLFEIMHTMRAMRRLKPDPVPDELIKKILEAGVCAPNG